MNAFKVNYKKEWKDYLLTLMSEMEIDNLPPPDRKNVKEITAHLSKKNILIPASSKGKKQVEDFIALLFSTYPRLMNASNKAKIEHLFSDTGRGTPQSTRNRKK